MKKLNGFIFVLLSFLAMEGSFGGTIRHDVSDDDYVSRGKDYKCVLRIFAIFEEEGKDVKYGGSCVAISKRWVVTAAHVMNGSKRGFISIGNKNIAIEKVIVHKDFKHGHYGSTDLAMCKLAGDLDLEAYPELYEANDECGKICGIAGYGKTGTGLSGAFKTDEKKRGGTNTVDSISENSIYCVMNKTDPTALEILISHGDSGGGLFIDGKLAGVNSSVLAADGEPDSNYGDESCHIRVSRHKEWILLTIERN